MSTDLEFRQDHPEIQLPPTIKVKTISPQSSDSTIQTDKGDADDDGCRTPTSPEHMIPVIFSCPPPPRKKRPVAVVSRKRKLEFFEIVGREEIESFFRSAYSMKRRRACK